MHVMRKILLLVLLAALPILAATKTPQQLYNEAVAAYKNKDYATYLSVMSELYALRPKLPIVVANYAGALALNGRPEEAVAALRRLPEQLQVATDLSDHDLDSLRARDDFRAVEAEVKELRAKRITSSAVAFRIPQKGLIAEAIAYDPKTGAYFVSSVRKRKIVRIDRHGVSHDFVTKQIYAVDGLALDARRRILWAGSAAYPMIEGFKPEDEKENALYRIDADSGRIVKRYEVPVPANGKVLVDGVSVAPDGTVYISNSFGSLFRLRPDGDAVEPFVPRGVMGSAQASVVARGMLYVADYAGPIWAVDPKSGDSVRVAMPPDLVTSGTDGLGYADGSLLLIQNGIAPARVVRVWLDPSGLRATRSQILEMNNPLMDEPTNGVVVGHDFVWIAGSQANRFQAEPPQLEKLRDSVILRTRLR
jgi:streptogramin lyase